MVFGVLVSLALVAVSVALNARMGYRSAESDIDGKLYGLGAGLGDCLKAIAPFMASWGVRHGDVLAAMSAVVLFGICTGYSFIASLGFAAEQRAGKAGIAQGQMDSYGELRGEKKRLEERLSFLGPQRSSREVETSIKAILNERAWQGGQTVGAHSAACTLNRKSTRAACERVGHLEVEKARAEEAEQVSADLEGVLAKLAGRRSAAVVLHADAQVDALAKFASLVTDAMGKEQIGVGLSLLLASFIEVGSGLGLYMVTTPWRQRKRGEEKEPAAQPAPGVKRLGYVDGYMLERIEPGDGMTAVDALHEDYVRWCRRRNAVPYGKAEFARRFEDLGRDVGLEATSRGQRGYYRNLRLVGEGVKRSQA